MLFNEVWCVTDVDEHKRLEPALDKAKGNDIRVALSNPCFELWLLLHFRESPGAQHRHELQRRVRNETGGSTKHVDFSKYESGYQDAVRRAALLTKTALEDGEPRRNPTTTVYQLTVSIDSAARKANEDE